MYIQTECIWYTTPKYLYWFRGSLGWFSKKNPRDLDPPNHFHSNLGFLDFFSFHSPLAGNVNKKYSSNPQHFGSGLVVKYPLRKKGKRICIHFLLHVLFPIFVRILCVCRRLRFELYSILVDCRYWFIDRGTSVVECQTRNQVSPGSNPALLPCRRLGIFVLSIDAPVDSAVQMSTWL